MSAISSNRIQAVGYKNITSPVQGAANDIFLLHLRNFSRLAQVAELERTG
jgi:hypothetical protein